MSETEFFSRSAGAATVAEANRLLEAFYSANTPCLIVGQPGCGKTALVSAFAEAHDMGEPVVLIGSQMDPTDVVGLPFATNVNGVSATGYLAPVWQQKLLDGKPHLLFLDEFSNTSRAVQAALLKLIGERTFANGQKMADDTFIVAAMNPRSSAVDYNALKGPVINRMALISLEPLCEEFLDGFSNGWPNAQPEPLSNSPAWSMWTDLIARFLRQNPQWFLEEPPTGHNTSSTNRIETMTLDNESERFVVESTWATPRSWEAARRCLVSLNAKKDLNNLTLRALRGVVGYRATAAFAYFCQKELSLDPYEVVKNPASCDWASLSLNDAQDLASAIEGIVETCNGEDSRPTPAEVIEFLLCCAGKGETPTPQAAVYFAPKMAGTSVLRKALEKIKPENIASLAWRTQILDIYEAFLNADSLATQGSLDVNAARKAGERDLHNDKY